MGRPIYFGKKFHYNWYAIETLNEGLGITKASCYVDDNGYLRWKSSRRLCHRDIAFNYIYKKGSYKQEFSKYDIHHKDEYKFNNNPNNLEIILREEHVLEHREIIIENGRKYISLAPADTRKKQTGKAIRIGGKWYPKSQLITREGYL